MVKVFIPLEDSVKARKLATGMEWEPLLMLGIQTAEARMAAQPTGKKRSVETEGGEMVEHGK